MLSQNPCSSNLQFTLLPKGLFSFMQFFIIIGRFFSSPDIYQIPNDVPGVLPLLHFPLHYLWPISSVLLEYHCISSLPVLWTIFCFIILKWLETNFFFLLKPLLNLTFHNIFLALEFRVMLAVIAPSSQCQDLDKLVFYFPMFSYSFHTPCSLPLFQSLTKIPSLVCSNLRFIAC